MRPRRLPLRRGRGPWLYTCARIASHRAAAPTPTPAPTQSTTERAPDAMAAVAGAVTLTIAAACTAAVLSLASSSSSSDDEARTRSVATSGAEAGSPLPAPPSSHHECAVCLSELPAGAGSRPQAAVRALPACGHAFHADCIGRWLPLRPECPLCRRPVLLAAGGQQAAAPAWARPATTIACGFGDGRVVWTRSPSARQ
ncbi:hypothetical protein BDA96_01G369500 [Sorghum bicolor]|uniref:RING-type E3 ubiquitin transferase n=2 Tax=Sorghum bicolor TaxID=4558 RepID=A0A1Z5S960_SORBI|nr:probable E3 ubiquitin-protein ligase ATL44 [Sorghum bicolor]KAG0550808.1 hypothetical protein BDA96_01G369500 [Sorghum bicolor]OQU92448.1 hypothetical protein SORBI_3001G345900 [Sorghum bicolor]|eukprot:XP_002467733.2 probable E3 ubiquitin-protein ligase ATL44 [Sorghum bicolor]